MKKFSLFMLTAATSFLLATPVLSAEVAYNPGTQFYDMNSNGVLSLWGVAEAGGNALVANPDYGWPSEMAVASWLTTLLKAQQMGLGVVIGYDPNTRDIWYIGKPR